jgi:hypothetical protein
MRCDVGNRASNTNHPQAAKIGKLILARDLSRRVRYLQTDERLVADWYKVADRGEKFAICAWSN